jgi:hypothetical protein
MDTFLLWLWTGPNFDLLLISTVLLSAGAWALWKDRQDLKKKQFAPKTQARWARGK